MRIKKSLIYVTLLLFLSLPIALYLVNFRWGGGDAGSYIGGSEAFFESFSLDSYSISGALFSPFIAFAGGNPDALVYASLFYRIGFSCALPASQSSLIYISVISFLFFPLHSLLSLFPGKDVFSFGFFILLLYSVLQGLPYAFSYSFAFLSIVFRPLLGVFLVAALLSCSLHFFLLPVFRVSARRLMLFLPLFMLPLVALLLSQATGFSFVDVQERISLDVDAGYFNVTGYTQLPLSALNLFFPLLSANPISIYSLLALENVASLYFIMRFLARPVAPNYSLISFKFICVCVITYALVFSTLWPNITDTARKIYPLTFCGAASYFLLRGAHKSQGMKSRPTT